jgi:site-specific DNA-methyltransferase (adenine-specific)
VKNQCPALSENNPALSQPEFFGAELLRPAATTTCKTSAGESADNAVMKESAIPPPKPPRLAYHDQENDLRLYHGDCLDLLDEISAQYPDGCFDMVFADPPYFLSNNGSTCKGGERASVNKGHWDESGGLGADFKFTRAWLRRVKRALDPGGTIWVSGTQHSIQVVGFVLQSLKFRILNDITWEKLNPPPNLACRQFTHSTETLIWAARDEGADHIFNYDLMRRINRGSQMQSVWRMNAPTADEKVFGDHPTQKPVALITRCLLAATCESVTASHLRFAPKACRKASASTGARSQRYNPGSSPVTRCTNNTKCTRGRNGQASNGGAAVRGSVVSRMARKVSREILVTPSKSTALRR